MTGQREGGPDPCSHADQKLVCRAVSKVSKNVKGLIRTVMAAVSFGRQFALQSFLESIHEEAPLGSPVNES